MSAEEDRKLRAFAMLDRAEVSEKRNLLWEKATSLGKEFQALGELLQERPDTISVESYKELLNHKTLDQLVPDLDQVQKDLSTAEEKADRLGCPKK
jgi:hypothetical protein